MYMYYNVTQYWVYLSQKSAIGICGTASSTSKSTIGSVSWGSHAAKQRGSNQSLPSNNSNMAVALQSTGKESINKLTT